MDLKAGATRMAHVAAGNLANGYWPFPPSILSSLARKMTHERRVKII
jgi:hypothetical protein